MTANGLIEPYPVQDIFCSGMGKVEDIGGGCMRFYLYATQLNDDGVEEYVVVAKLIAPSAAVPDAIKQLIAAATAKVVSLVGGTAH